VSGDEQVREQAREQVREQVEVRSGVYHDSVTLLQVSRTVGQVEGVSAAQVAMATDLNVEVLRRMLFDVPPAAGPNDLVVAVRAVDDAALAAAVGVVDRELAGGRAGRGVAEGAGAAERPRTTGAAARAGGATLALVSVPGQHAFPEAMDALEAGLDVLVFSDNVPVEHEVRLKAEAARRGLLVMGPDCGTAVVGGVGLGFANVVRPGPVSLVAASGTGAQQVMCLLDGADVGVRHCLGVGGRDLSAAVGGASARQALRMLDDDPGTDLIVLVGKPPAPEVEAALADLVAGLRTPVLTALLGPGRPDLTAAVEQAVRTLGLPWREPRWWPAPTERTGRYTRLLGAFSGGTLCDEAMALASARLGPVASNIPLAGASRVAADASGGAGHIMIDFGDDELTRGRPHPMIDGSLRAEWITLRAEEAGQNGDGIVLLMDVVLGHAASPDPARELVPALDAAQAVADAAVVVSLCGTDDDPQGLDDQAERLRAAGASVHLSNAGATRKALELLADDVGAAGGAAEGGVGGRVEGDAQGKPRGVAR
jgi:FdrA protein